MQRFTFKLFLLITFLFLSSGDFLAQVNWTKYPGNPVLTGQPGTWYAYTSMNSVLYNADSSRYEMWFTAGAQIEFPYTIGFAWSSDGIAWNVYSPNPVLTPTPGSWDAYMVLAPYVIRENGQYKMWFTGCQTNSLLFRIGYATSPDGINWTKHPSNPIFLPSHSTWELAAVAYPCIMPYSSGYKMWYGGFNANFSVTGIGYATSPDGITWERYTGNPVLSPGAGGIWDHVLFAPRVLYIDNIYYMFYSGETVVYQSDKIGLATSADGLVWTKYPSNPILKPTAGQWDGDRTNSGYVILDADTLKMYYCGMPVGATNMQLGMATSPFTPLPLPPGTYTIGTGGNFATIQDAFNKLETDGVAGNVTLELIDELYTAPTGKYGFLLNGPIPGAGQNSRVTIRPAANRNVVIEGNNEGVLSLFNTSYVTFDGVAITGPTTLTIHALQNSAYVYNDALDFVNNSDHNIIRNTIFVVEDIARLSAAGTFLVTQTGSAPDSNLIESNFVKRAGEGFLIGDAYATLKGKGNVIRGNRIGLDTDSVITLGIEVKGCENAIIENNIVQNLKSSLSGTRYTTGIDAGSSSGTIIRNNVIRNLTASGGFGTAGIRLEGGPGILGSDQQVYNNMIYDLQSASNDPGGGLTGIKMGYQDSPKIYYNSVYISGTGENQLGSAALYIYTNVANADIKNNIFVNTRDESPYCASAIYDYSAANIISDYNDLYYDNTNANNCLVRILSTKYNTLADWQATGKDLHSYVEMPHFMSPTDLHIDETIATYLESRGTPITEIDLDFDGNTRNAATPDIGADEFNGIVVGVEEEETLPTEYALLQNYPNPFNPSTVISYQLPVSSDIVLKVFDVLGNEITTLVDEFKIAGRYEVEYDASTLPSGVYFYQLRAGEYTAVKKMILLK